MPDSGGVFSRVYNWVTDRDASVPITASRMDAEFDGIATALNNRVTRDGSSAPTANLPMGGYIHTGVGAATARTHYARADQVQDGSMQFATASGTDTYTATLTPAITAYANGQSFRIKFTNGNTGAATLNVNGVGAVDLQKRNGTALASGDIPANSIFEVTYNSTGPKFIIDREITAFQPLDADLTTIAGLSVARGALMRGSSSPAWEILALGAAGTFPQSDGTDLVNAKTTALNLAIGAVSGMALIGGYLTASVATNILTVAIKTTAGADPSSSSPVLCLLPDETIATGAPDLVTITAATSLAVPDTATLGTANSTPFALYVVLFNDGALGIVNCRSSSSIIPLDEGALYSATAIGTGADSAQVFYSTAGHTNKPFRIVARLTYASGLATAGTWASAPTRIEQAFRGMKLPGDIVQSNRTDTAAVATGSTVTDDDDSIPQVTQGDEYMAVTITPRSAANMLRVQASAWVSQSADQNITGALHKNDGADAVAAVTRYNVANAQIHTPITINYMALASSAAATEFQLRVGPGGAATVTLNGVSGGRLMGGVFNSYMTVEEIQA